MVSAGGASATDFEDGLKSALRWLIPVFAVTVPIAAIADNPRAAVVSLVLCITSLLFAVWAKVAKDRWKRSGLLVTAVLVFLGALAAIYSSASDGAAAPPPLERPAPPPQLPVAPPPAKESAVIPRNDSQEFFAGVSPIRVGYVQTDGVKATITAATPTKGCYSERSVAQGLVVFAPAISQSSGDLIRLGLQVTVVRIEREFVEIEIRRRVGYLPQNGDAECYSPQPAK